jgi:hypothetical protein
MTLTVTHSLFTRMLVQLAPEFSLEEPRTPATHLHFSRLMLIIQFSFQNLGSAHANVAKLARRVFTLAARNTAADTPTFNQVWELLGALDPSLQMRMRKGLAAAIEELYLADAAAAAAGGDGAATSTATSFGGLSSSILSSASSDDKVRSPQELDRSAFLEKFLNECSNQHTEMTFTSNNSSGFWPTAAANHKRRSGWRPPLMRSTSHSPSRQLAASSRSSSRSPSRVNSGNGGGPTFFKPQLKPSLCQSVYNISHQASNSSGHSDNNSRHNQPTGGLGSGKRSAYSSAWVHTKPRVLSRLAQKSRLHELAREVLPKFDLSFLTSSSPHQQQSHAHNLAYQHHAVDLDRMDDDDPDMEAEHMESSRLSQAAAAVTKSRSMTRLAATSSRNASPTKGVVGGGGGYYNPANNRTPTAQRKRGGSRDSGVSCNAPANTASSSICSRSPLSSPVLVHRDKRLGGGAGSCKDLVDYEESLALALALSKSIYHETPLPLIPGLSAQKLQLSNASQDVLAHPHRDVSFFTE